MTLLSSISKIGTIKNGNSLNEITSTISNNEAKGSPSFSGNQSTKSIGDLLLQIAIITKATTKNK
ncbi:hssA/2C/7E family protein [Dictyostelium discoideum AX4]|uniref:Protein sigN173 n=1 Tax=Dictyostelium discoideum TaxID=44689 RepID=SI173_DICDI|nr:hssA/2C/7E family protein [Dictyostelium discoideum AX4]Q54LD8.1 RecName: Full=Protein sigN173; AltName: Full=SrfA-induced gene N-like protein 173 [Dictyostelium discoideum]EAL64146.1 hssA/2C/7E family protein [Dictyostelium discoideum AX4]|eukprot:XP_637623.1 hssA/2C/7E family protein [Dictyostelium discoideum AX4]